MNGEIETTNESAINNDELKRAFEEKFIQIGRQNRLIGFQVACNSIFEKITVFERTPGNKSNNDHKRLIKDIKKFCETGLSRKINIDEEPETVQN